VERDDVQRRTEELIAAGDLAGAEQLAADSWRSWMAAGDLEGGRVFLAAVLDREDARPSRARALALYGDGILAFRQGDQVGSQARNEQALAEARAIGDRPAESLALVGMSRVALRDGRNDDVVRLAREARSLAGDDSGANLMPLHLQAAGTRLAGDYDGARALYEESLQLSRRLGDSALEAMELHNLAHVALHQGEVDAAERRFEEWRRLTADSDAPYDRAMAALNEAAVAAAHGERQRARNRLDRAEEILADAGISLDPDDAFEARHLRGIL
jgi:ATP/maltotriose-dependent transcriptional regulator MalT